MKKVLTIAGSDSGGGAGIQADLKTFAALGVYGTSALTAVTAQNTRGVTGVIELDAGFVARQIDAIMDDIGADAVKIGMVANAAIVAAIADRLDHYRVKHLVIDPVMISTSGHPLLQPDAEATLAQRLLPMADLVTPNLPEAEVLAEMPVQTVADMREAAGRIRKRGCRAVLVKGGHLEGDPVDVLLDDSGWRAYTSERIPAVHTHGTGCTYAAAITACLAAGSDLHAAVQEARDYLTEAIRHALPVGGGPGPVHHFHRWLPPYGEGGP